MDSAYGAPEIRAFSQKLGHVPIIDLNPRRRPQVKADRKREALAQRRIGQVSPEARRTRERSTVERVNGRLKEEFGGRQVRVRGPGKVMCHLMFGILALTHQAILKRALAQYLKRAKMGGPGTHVRTASDNRRRRPGRGLQGENSGVLEYAGPRESPAQAKDWSLFWPDRAKNLRFPTGGLRPLRGKSGRLDCASL